MWSRYLLNPIVTLDENTYICIYLIWTFFIYIHNIFPKKTYIQNLTPSLHQIHFNIPYKPHADIGSVICNYSYVLEVLVFPPCYACVSRLFDLTTSLEKRNFVTSTRKENLVKGNVSLGSNINWLTKLYADTDIGCIAKSIKSRDFTSPSAILFSTSSPISLIGNKNIQNLLLTFSRSKCLLLRALPLLTSRTFCLVISSGCSMLLTRFEMLALPKAFSRLSVTTFQSNFKRISLKHQRLSLLCH